MQHSLSETSNYREYKIRRGQRPVLMKRTQFLFMIALALIDLGCTWLSFYLSYTIWRAIRRSGHRPISRVLALADTLFGCTDCHLFLAAYVPAPTRDQPSG